MTKLFFLEIPLSLLFAQVGAYSSYIVAVGLGSNLDNPKALLGWLLAATALIFISLFFQRSQILKEKIVFRKLVFVFYPLGTALLGLYFLVAGSVS